MDEMMRIISRYPNGTYLKVSWGFENVVIGGLIETIYETDNGLEEDAEDYQEYFACLFKVEKIVQNLEKVSIKKGQLLEISKCNKPTNIELADGTVIWSSIVG